MEGAGTGGTEAGMGAGTEEDITDGPGVAGTMAAGITVTMEDIGTTIGMGAAFTSTVRPIIMGGSRTAMDTRLAILTATATRLVMVTIDRV